MFIIIIIIIERALLMAANMYVIPLDTSNPDLGDDDDDDLICTIAPPVSAPTLFLPHKRQYITTI